MTTERSGSSQANPDTQTIDSFISSALGGGGDSPQADSPPQQDATTDQQQAPPDQQLTPQKEIEQIRQELTNLSQQRDRYRQELDQQRQAYEEQQQRQQASEILQRMQQTAAQKYQQLTQAGLGQDVARQQAIEFARLHGQNELRQIAQQRQQALAHQLAQEYGVNASDLMRSQNEQDMRDRAQLLQRVNQMEQRLNGVQSTQNINNTLNQPTGVTTQGDDAFLRASRNGEIDLRNPDNMTRLKSIMEQRTGQKYG